MDASYMRVVKNRSTHSLKYYKAYDAKNLTMIEW